MIRLTCKKCKNKIQCPIFLFGYTVKCPYCKEKIDIRQCNKYYNIIRLFDLVLSLVLMVLSCIISGIIHSRTGGLYFIVSVEVIFIFLLLFTVIRFIFNLIIQKSIDFNE